MHAATFGPDGKLYVFGGCACAGGYTVKDDPESRRKALIEELEWRRSVKEVEAYDPKTNKWTPRAPMPTPRQLLSATLGADGRIYVIGGSRSLAGEGTDVVEIYDPATDRWSDGPPLRTARKSHASTMTPDGRIWVTGGVGANCGALNPLQVLPGQEAGPLASVETLGTRPKGSRVDQR